MYNYKNLINKPDKKLKSNLLLATSALLLLALPCTTLFEAFASVTPHLLKAFSNKRYVESARDQGWSVTRFSKKSKADTLLICALRVEFASDNSELTTGDGKFGIRNDKREFEYYNRKDTIIYRYDKLPHDAEYFESQLEFVKRYFAKVSRNKLHIEYKILPNGRDKAYSVPDSMGAYSPPTKKRKETWDEFYYRRTIGHMKFIVDAIKSAAKDSFFASIVDSSGILYFRDIDSSGSVVLKKTAFLIIHAGASYLTDGGVQGSMGRNSPSDMIDAFFSEELFRYFADTLHLDTISYSSAKPQIGVKINGFNGKPVIINEVMMVSETSNQDGLNWGIHGILVNQVARQLGIPDLFSTTSGISGVGAFCIMDFYGYSSGKGFIPPYPCAWVRAFMGWDVPVIADIASAKQYRVKATNEAADGDTSILLVPINDHEYYLIENRQRNLTGRYDIFNYDTAQSGDRSVYINPYDPVNISANITDSTGNANSNVILSVINYDVSLPASGVLVWHIDEEIIRDRLEYNVVNADSLFRGVCLVEADGVMDLGITFSDAFYQAVFDYGGAEDVFAHRALIRDSALVNSFGPFTRPSTHSNDGGQTYLSITVTPYSGFESARTETSKLIGRDYRVINFSDTFFTVNVKWDFLLAGWPKQVVADDRLFEPVLCNVHSASKALELIALSSKGRVYVWSADSLMPARSIGKRTTFLPRFSLSRDSSQFTDTVYFADSLEGVFTFPTAIGKKVFFPSINNKIYVLTSIENSPPYATIWDTVVLAQAPSTYVCDIEGQWAAVGCANGAVCFFDPLDLHKRDSCSLPTNSPVTALAAIWGEADKIVSVQEDGALCLCRLASKQAEKLNSIVGGIPPFKLATGDVDGDGLAEIVVCDSRQGLWMYRIDGTVAAGWSEKPNDWASVYYYNDENKSTDDRLRYPVNTSTPALADLNGDGCLEIIIGGTNGLYAFNYKGVLTEKWPAYLDRRFWYQRKSIVTTPAVVSAKDNSALVVFSTPNGENETFDIARIIGSNKEAGKVYFVNHHGQTDSIGGLAPSYIDTLLVFGDSLILPYFLPGGLVDAVTAQGKRPKFSAGSNQQLQSYWPFSIGGPATTSPLIGFFNDNSMPDMIVASANGLVWCWELSNYIIGDTFFWRQPGYDNTRSFAYVGKAVAKTSAKQEPLQFYSYPNPAYNISEVAFRFKFSGPTQKVKLDVFTYTGYHVFTKELGNFENNYRDWNEVIVSIKDFGPAIYRCRIEAIVEGKKHVKFWKMAVVK